MKKKKLRKILKYGSLSVLMGWVLITFLQAAVLFLSKDLIRVSFTGLENMFHAPYEYYAVLGDCSLKIPKIMVKAWKPEWLEDGSIYEDEDKSYYFVQLQYTENDRPLFQSETYCMVPGREHYLISYRKWTRNSKEITGEHMEWFLNAADQLYDYSTTVGWDTMRWGSGDNFGMLSFMMITDGKKTLVIQDDEIVYKYQNGKLRRIMKVPEKGQVDYCIFRENANRNENTKKRGN